MMSDARAETPWSIDIEGVGDGPFDLERADRIVEALADHGPAVALGDDRLSVRFDVAAASARDAVERGLALFASAAPGLEPVRVEAERVDALERHLAESNVPELLGLAEIAAALGVSKQRAGQLVGARGFPAPVARLRSGPIWRRRAAARFLGGWDRRPGRRPRRRAVPPDRRLGVTRAP